MKSLGVVNRDGLLDGALRLAEGGKGCVQHELAFEDSVYAFGDGIFGTVHLLSRGDADAMMSKHVGVGSPGVLFASIAVMDDAFSSPCDDTQSPAQRHDAHLGCGAFGKVVTNDASTAKVGHQGQVVVPLDPPQVGEVAHKDGASAFGFFLPGKEIRGLGFGCARGDRRLAFDAYQQPKTLQEAEKPVSPKGNQRAELHVEFSPSNLRLPGSGPPNGFDEAFLDLVHRCLSGLPLIGSLRAHAEVSAGGLDAVLSVGVTARSSDELELDFFFEPCSSARTWTFSLSTYRSSSESASARSSKAMRSWA